MTDGCSFSSSERSEYTNAHLCGRKSIKEPMGKANTNKISHYE